VTGHRRRKKKNGRIDNSKASLEIKKQRYRRKRWQEPENDRKRIGIVK